MRSHSFCARQQFLFLSLSCLSLSLPFWEEKEKEKKKEKREGSERLQDGCGGRRLWLWLWRWWRQRHCWLWCRYHCRASWEPSPRCPACNLQAHGQIANRGMSRTSEMFSAKSRSGISIHGDLGGEGQWLPQRANLRSSLHLVSAR